MLIVDLCLMRVLVHGHFPVELRTLIRSFVGYRQFDNSSLQNAIAILKHDKTLCYFHHGHISYWDVSKVSVMHNLFRDIASFNQPLEQWNVSNVTNMSHMFCKASSFNQTLEQWNVSNVVINMACMICV